MDFQPMCIVFIELIGTCQEAFTFDTSPYIYSPFSFEYYRVLLETYFFRVRSPVKSSSSSSRGHHKDHHKSSSSSKPKNDHRDRDRDKRKRDHSSSSSKHKSHSSKKSKR